RRSIRPSAAPSQSSSSATGRRHSSFFAVSSCPARRTAGIPVSAPCRATSGCSGATDTLTTTFGSSASEPTSMPAWRVSGSYFEACNCEAICPCRRQGGQKLTTGSTYGVCSFALSWRILRGAFGTTDLSGLSAVLAGEYRDDEKGKPWQVTMYVDVRATLEQQQALAEIFTGRAGGTAFTNYAKAIAHVHAVKPARIDLDHRPAHWSIKAGDYVVVRGSEVVTSPLGPVTCSIPGLDHPGDEVRTELMRVADPPFGWDVVGRCGF